MESAEERDPVPQNVNDVLQQHFHNTQARTVEKGEKTNIPPTVLSVESEKFSTQSQSQDHFLHGAKKSLSYYLGYPEVLTRQEVETLFLQKGDLELDLDSAEVATGYFPPVRLGETMVLREKVDYYLSQQDSQEQTFFRTLIGAVCAGFSLVVFGLFLRREYKEEVEKEKESERKKDSEKELGDDVEREKSEESDSDFERVAKSAPASRALVRVVQRVSAVRRFFREWFGFLTEDFRESVFSPVKSRKKGAGNLGDGDAEENLETGPSSERNLRRGNRRAPSSASKGNKKTSGVRSGGRYGTEDFADSSDLGISETHTLSDDSGGGSSKTRTPKLTSRAKEQLKNKSKKLLDRMMKVK